MIRVQSDVKVYEVKGEEIPLGNKVLRVESHWNRGGMVVLTIDDCRITVSASDLQKAIDNATNSNRYGREHDR